MTLLSIFWYDFARNGSHAMKELEAGVQRGGEHLTLLDV